MISPKSENSQCLEKVNLSQYEIVIGDSSA